MFDRVDTIINHVWTNDYGSSQQYVYYICGALIIILTVVTIDLIYRVFSHFWRSGK